MKNAASMLTSLEQYNEMLRSYNKAKGINESLWNKIQINSENNNPFLQDKFIRRYESKDSRVK